jgi:hypothetical protein
MPRALNLSFREKNKYILFSFEEREKFELPQIKEMRNFKKMV